MHVIQNIMHIMHIIQIMHIMHMIMRIMHSVIHIVVRMHIHMMHIIIRTMHVLCIVYANYANCYSEYACLFILSILCKLLSIVLYI